MQIDSGRAKDLDMLEGKLKLATTDAKRNQIQTAINRIRSQTENIPLARERELLMEARRRATNAQGTVNIDNARKDADKLEEKIHSIYGA